ncbi:hypothetical protein C3737_16715 [Aeromonas jandaei]|nr:hypothetical protein C3737_16715 [Aeromonas jandaei]
MLIHGKNGFKKMGLKAQHTFVSKVEKFGFQHLRIISRYASKFLAQIQAQVLCQATFAGMMSVL